MNDFDKKIICELQNDIPLEVRPYKTIAEKLNISEEELINKINYYIEKKYIRRIGATLRHREIGLTANPMIVMKVSEEQIESAGEKVAAFSQVTHCYQRFQQSDFPYNLYAMVHCQSTEECEILVKKIIEASGAESYNLLYSTQELKKTSMKYFSKNRR